MSLYATPMWDEMTREQQIDLSRQELVNTLSAGIWFENMLNQTLLRTILHEDPTSRSTHYKLTELGDETRHMVMFGKAIERIGAKPVRPRLFQRMIINAMPLVFQRGSMLWVAALIGEEIFDSLQRQMMDDPELQPMIQRLMRIHVTEEARHIQFARDGARKRVPTCRASTNGSWPTSTGSAGTSSATCSAIRSPTPGRAWTPSGHERPRAPARTVTKSPGRLCPARGVFDRGGPDGSDRAAQLEAQQVSVTPGTGQPSTSSSSARVPPARHVAAELRAAGDHRRLGPGRPRSASSVFDDATDTWALRTAAGENFRGRCRHRGRPTVYRPVDTGVARAQRLSGAVVSRGGVGPRFRSGAASTSRSSAPTPPPATHMRAARRASGLGHRLRARPAPNCHGAAALARPAPNAGCAATPDRPQPAHARGPQLVGVGDRAP